MKFIQIQFIQCNLAPICNFLHSHELLFEKDNYVRYLINENSWILWLNAEVTNDVFADHEEKSRS